MAVHLASVVTELEDALDSPRPAKAAAKSLEDEMRKTLSSSAVLGADLRLTRGGFKGPPVRLEGEHKPSLAWIELGGPTYALVDGGRQKAREFILPKRKGRTGKVRASKKRKGRKGHPPALLTPRGPRYRVKGSSGGRTAKHITDRFAPKALDGAVEAAEKVVADIFAQVV